MDNNFFDKGESAVNFCEPDTYIFGIGEPWNVLSSLIIVFFGLYGLYNVNYRLIIQNYNLIDSNSYEFNNSLSNKHQSNILYGLLSCIGLGSMFFHSQLSPFAHWVDIIFISIMLVYSQYILSPFKKLLFNKLKYLGLMILHLLTSIYVPQIHIFLLFGTGFVIKNRIEYKIQLNSITESNCIDKLEKKYWWIKKYFCLGLILWIIDYFFCPLILPYHIHWIFHIFIGLVAYEIIKLVKYL